MDKIGAVMSNGHVHLHMALFMCLHICQIGHVYFTYELFMSLQILVVCFVDKIYQGYITILGTSRTWELAL